MGFASCYSELSLSGLLQHMWWQPKAHLIVITIIALVCMMVQFVPVIAGVRSVMDVPEVPGQSLSDRDCIAVHDDDPCMCWQVRDLYWTFRNFRNRVADFLRYRRVTANMDERFGDATAEDLARCDGICIICREDLSPGARNKKLPCNHVFHMHCLRCAP